MNRTDFEVYHTEGRFRLVRFHYSTDLQHTYIEHCCVKKSWRGRDWIGHIYKAESRGLPCSVCQAHIPDGLQAVFWFMKEEGRPAS